MGKTMKAPVLNLLAGLTSAFAPSLTAAVNLQDLLPMQEGYTVVTCSSGLNPAGDALELDNPVVGIFNTSTPALAGVTIGDDSSIFPWECFHNEEVFQDVPSASEVWTGANLGEVFGIALDDQSPPNIYVSATSAYIKPGFVTPVWPAGESAGSVYRLDGTTGEITSCVQLPSISDAALGNLCFHRDSNEDGWLYISNLEDGYIYRVSESTCIVANTFQHPSAPADDGLPGPCQFGRRIWGVAVHNDRLYYHLWNDYDTTPQQIWSVALEADGDFDLSSVILEVDVPVYEAGATSSPPVSDIDFDESGNMYLSERSYGDLVVPHMARVLKFTGSSGSYVACPVDYYLVGALAPGDNSAGGVAADCNGRLWATSNYINGGAFTAYGLQSYPDGGNFGDSPPWMNSYIVDLDGISGQDQKGDFGEVDILRTTCIECMTVAVSDIICPVQPGSDFNVLLEITNLTGQSSTHWTISPCPVAELPSGATTVAGSDTYSFGSPLADSATDTVTLPLASSFAGTTVCFDLTLEDGAHNPLCTVKVCIELPVCDCFIVESKDLECVRQPDGSLKWTLDVTLTNLTGFEVVTIGIEGAPGSNVMNTSVAPDGGSIADGATGSFTVCLESASDPPLVSGDFVCFDIILYSANMLQECGEECCVRLPYCDPHVIEDDCVVSCRTPCCPLTGKAMVSFTICNNSFESRTYNWGIEGAPGCGIILAPSAFSPVGGSVTIPANSCETIVIEVDCPAPQLANCAAFEICFNRINPTGPEICCKGVIYRPLVSHFILKQSEPDDPIVLPWGQTGTIKFDIANQSTLAMTADVFFVSDFGVVDFGQGNNNALFSQKVILLPAEEKCIELPIKLTPRYASIPRRSFAIKAYAQGHLLETSTVIARSNDLAISDIDLDVGGGTVDLEIYTAREKRYQLQWLQTEPGPPTWVDLLPEFDGADPPVDIRAPLVPGVPKRLYRVTEAP